MYQMLPSWPVMREKGKTVDKIHFIPQNQDETSVQKALRVLSTAMQDDPDFAWSWHCNVAMSFYDAMPEGEHESNHGIANKGAERFMKLAFKVDTVQPTGH